MRRIRLHAVGLAWGACAAALFVGAGGLWNGVGLHGETHGVYVPKYEAAATAMLNGRLPLWNPDEFCGIPLLGLSHGAVLYPPVPLAFAWLSPRRALQALYAGHMVLLAWGTVAYLTGGGVRGAVAGLAALIALAGTFSGVAYVGVDHPPFLMCVAWVPIALACWQRAQRAGGRRWIAGLAVAVAAQWLAGYPQFLPSTAVVLGVVAAIGTGSWRAPDAPLVRRLGVLAAGLGLGTALAGMQVVPLVEVARESSRPGSMPDILARRAGFRIASLAKLYMLTPLRPAFAAALGLALVASWRPDRRVVAWMAALLWAAFALNPPLGLLYELPPLRLVRNPLEWIALSSLFLGLLATAGAARLIGSGRRSVAVLGIAVAAVAGWQAARLVYAAPTRMSGRAPDGAQIAERVYVLEALRREHVPDSRVLALKEIQSGAPLRFGLPSAGGFEPSLRPARIDHLLAALDLDHLAFTRPQTATWAGVARRPDLAALLGVGMVVAEPRGVSALEAAGFRAVGRLPSGGVVLARPPVPRARLVHRVVRVAGEPDSLAAVVDGAGALAGATVVEGDAGVEVAEPPSGAEERVAIVADEPERLVLDVDAASPGVLVITDTAYPGWRAFVDDHPAPLWRVDHAFRGVPIAPGRHRVELAYRAASVQIGFASTLAATLVIALLLVRRPRSA